MAEPNKPEDRRAGASYAAKPPDGMSLTDPAPGVTVIVTCFNQASFVVSCLESVWAQTVPPRRVIVTDDASSDCSAERIREWCRNRPGSITLILNTTNRGLTATLSDALALVDTEHYAAIAADDWMCADRLEVQLGVMDERGEKCALVHSDMFIVDESGGGLRDSFHVDQAPLQVSDSFIGCLQPRGFVAAPSVLLRTEAVRSVGGYDDSIPMEDYDLWLRLAVLYEFAYVHRPLVYYRQVKSSLSRSVSDITIGEWRLLSLWKHTRLPGSRGLEVRRAIEVEVRTLYFRGRSGRLTRQDLDRLLPLHRTMQGRMLRLAAGLSVPGSWLSGLYRVLSVLRRSSRLRRAIDRR